MPSKYELYKGGAYVDTYTLAQLQLKLWEGKDKILQAACTGEAIGEYTIEPMQTKANENYKRKLLEEWDEIRFRIKPSLRKQEVN